MHICFILSPFEIYGPERGLALATITFEVTSELRARGIETTVVSPTDGSALYQGGRTIGLAYDPSSPTRSLLSRARGKLEGWDAPGYDSYVRQVSEALRTLDRPPDVLILFNDLVTGGLLKRHHQIPVLTWMQNNVSTRHRLGHRMFETTDGVLAVSNYIADSCHENFGPNGPPVSVVPNGVNPSTFTSPTDPEQTTTPVLKTCFVGRIDPNKGPLLAAQAIERAQGRGRDVVIDVAGPVLAWGQAPSVVDKYIAELECTLARTAGRWVGQVSRADLPAFFRAHAIAFVPSTAPEPFGLVALEAMAAGCAVIASNRGGLPEVCGRAALLIDPESQDQFDAALDGLARNAVSLANARVAGRAHAEERTWVHSTDRLLGVISTIS